MYRAGTFISRAGPVREMNLRSLQPCFCHPRPLTLEFFNFPLLTYSSRVSGVCVLAGRRVRPTKDVGGGREGLGISGLRWL